MAERIQPENNRTFTTGAGDWVGDLAWHGDVWFSRQGYISVAIEGSAAEKTINLNYPAIKPVPGKENTILFRAHYVIEAGSGFTSYWKLTDGVYTYEETGANFFDDPAWTPLGASITLEPDWNTETAQLLIRIGVIEDAPAELAFDDFSLEAVAPAKVDHLPLMGVH